MLPFPQNARYFAVAAFSLAALPGEMVTADESEVASPHPEGHYIAVYVGQSATRRLNEIITQAATERQNSYLIAAGHGRILRPGTRWRMEAEGQAVKHFGLQDHFEFNAVLVARWMRFPWDPVLDTRIAVGEGLSWATQEPPIEPRAGNDNRGSARLLNYLMLEIEAKPPASQWSGFFRIHHRSGIFGVFGGVHGGSNFLALGIRRYY